jgi:hypothetical protein
MQEVDTLSYEPGRKIRTSEFVNLHFPGKAILKRLGNRRLGEGPVQSEHNGCPGCSQHHHSYGDEDPAPGSVSF